ncbi:hypothetical protein [Streptomyces tanashiensis]|uniref:Type II secretion system protein GspF domain-containing protein n=1 Tax=Streptomyces tanashiensis TaxID=67367 RepID=A0ABY6QR95_9ACTN|nr:hypothetical protein [Streptomyces tanashiensis]UZX19690.1 hypothetical protein LDH80_02565 [Streptomyces tanashiensis]GGY18650.1 hypothetical protein GCM10010299_25390 [Streptomyces tanashiensis]
MAAEPTRLPEALASFALRHLGPGAGPAVERLRSAHPEADAATLRSLVISRGRRRVVAEGAFVGGPFLVFIPVAFCGALLSQVRTVLEIAATEGRDPTDPERAAELLVLQGVYEDTSKARAALDAHSAAPRARPGRGRTSRLWDLVMRMARLLGLLTPSGGEQTSRLSRVGQWVLVACVFLVGLVAPLVWLPYMAVSYNRATTRMMDRAVVFYAGSPYLRSPRRVRVDPSMVAAGLRALASLLLPLGGLLVVAATDTRIAGGQWPVAGIVLTASCLLTGGWWLWRRHRRRREPPP